MKLSFSALVFFFCCMPSALCQNEPFTLRVVNTGYQLNSAWEILYGPDDSLWVTESHAYLVSKIDPVSGNRRIVLDLNTKKNFSTSIARWPQGGLMGMALHPSMYHEWPSPSNPFVYIAYVYFYHQTPACNNNTGPCSFSTRIARYEYDIHTGQFKNEVVITESLAGSNDHNSGRLAIGQVDGADYLFYTIGDMGAGQFNNASRSNNAQREDIAEGKTLRFLLGPTGSGSNAWVPDDNPFSAGGGPTPVWSTGHRNAQGLVFGSNGKLYSSEQQDKSDDEINIIERGRNYGWPRASGYCDGNYSGLTLAGMPVGDEIQNCTELNAAEPIYTMYTHPNPALIGSGNMNWPTVACSSLDIYENHIIPGWHQSLLVPGLKSGTLLRLKLNAEGTGITDSSSVPIARNIGRLRDIAIAPDGLKIYVSCDMRGNYVLPDGKASAGPGPYAGRILELTYTGTVNAISEDIRSTYERNREYEVYPNPATDLLHVRGLRTTQKPLHYSLYDTQGSMIKQGRSNTDNFDIDIRRLQPGTYILRIANKFGINTATLKVVKH